VVRIDHKSIAVLADDAAPYLVQRVATLVGTTL
jgi:hypothetical protein